MKIKLKQLVKGIPFLEVKGSKEVEITGLCNNSKLAVPGFLFFAKKGKKQHGNSFIEEVKASGCVAVATDMFDPFLKDIVQIVHPDIVTLEFLIADRFYGSPSKKLLTVGITGTNGKTTTSYLIKHLFDTMDLPAGLIGTIEWIVKDTVFPSTHTTPDVITNQKLFHDMDSVGCKSVVMEVSSHALDQKRVAGIDFDVAIFTNLTEDHLDYHHTMEEYGKAKAKLFASLVKARAPEKAYPKVAVVNLDSIWHKEMIKNLTVSLVTYGLCVDADVRAKEIRLNPNGSECLICFQDQVIPFKSALIGKFNVYNCLAAIAAAVGIGLDLSRVLASLSSFKAVPGRLERVNNKLGKNVFVDYAHTEDALKNVLEALKEITLGRLLCVFGCGGDRDKQKRPKMGAVVEKLADLIFVTSDNPRRESPEDIVEEIILGIQDKKKVCVEVDRRKAIEKAISQMKVDDVLLIAGKGHEDYQVFSNHTIHFDDRIVAKEYCR